MPAIADSFVHVFLTINVGSAIAAVSGLLIALVALRNSRKDREKP